MTRLPLHWMVLATIGVAGCDEYTCLDTATCASLPVDGGDTQDASVAPGSHSPESDTTTSNPKGNSSENGSSESKGESTSSESKNDGESTSSESRNENTSAEHTEDLSSDGSLTTSGHDAEDSTSENSEGSTSDLTPVDTSDQQTSTGPQGCPDAPGGVCECGEGETQKCGVSGAKGACADGTQTCTAEGFYGPCDVTPSTDDCSVRGDDADCDGTPNSNCPCVDGDEQSCGPDTDVGQCKYGVSECASSIYGECLGAVDRAPRRCNSTQDYDCDGVPDNTLDDDCKCAPGDVQLCNKHPGFDDVEPCRPGNQTCELSEDGTRTYWGDCTGDIGPKASDTCIEGNNDDCSGQPNTNCTCIAGQTETCGERYNSKGICAVVELTCQDDGTWPGNATCTAASKQEICGNGIDENCDGTADDASSCPCSQNPSPCAHGTCNAASGSNYTCDCTGTGYEGTLCDKPIVQTIAGPTGASSCTVVGISDTGTAVAAHCEIGEAVPRGYFWTQSGGWAAAKVPAGYTVVNIYAFTPDGTKAAGSIKKDGTANAVRWSGLSATATLLNNSEWKYAGTMSTNGNTLYGSDVGGIGFLWTGGGTTAPTQYPGGLQAGVLSGDGTKLFTRDDEGFRIWTSATASTLYTIADYLAPIAVSNSGGTMVGYFPGGTPNTIYKYNPAGSETLNSTAGCKPLSISSDGRYMLGKCPSGLSRWLDATPTTVQSLITSTGSSVSIRTNVDGTMSYNAKYVVLPSTSTGIVIVHLPSP